jgi:hypothetical protein
MLFVARSFVRIRAFDSSIRSQGRKSVFLLPNVDLALTLLSFRAAPCVCSYDISGEGR